MKKFFDWYLIMLPVFRMTFTSHMRPGWQKTTDLTKHRKVNRILKILYLKNIDWMEDLLYKHFLQPAEFLSTSSDFCRNFMNCIIFLHFLIVYLCRREMECFLYLLSTKHPIILYCHSFSKAGKPRKVGE